MGKMVITESRLTGVLRKLINDFLDQHKNISLNHKNIGILDGTLKMSLKDLRYEKKMGDGKNLFEVDILIEELIIHYPNGNSYEVRSPVTYLPTDIFKRIEFLLNKEINLFIPTVYIKVKFSDLSTIGSY